MGEIANGAENETISKADEEEAEEEEEEQGQARPRARARARLSGPAWEAGVKDAADWNANVLRDRYLRGPWYWDPNSRSPQVPRVCRVSCVVSLRVSCVVSLRVSCVVCAHSSRKALCSCSGWNLAGTPAMLQLDALAKYLLPLNARAAVGPARRLHRRRRLCLRADHPAQRQLHHPVPAHPTRRRYVWSIFDSRWPSTAARYGPLFAARHPSACPPPMNGHRLISRRIQRERDRSKYLVERRVRATSDQGGAEPGEVLQVTHHHR